ncbi:hypothetical protein PIB30_093547, partial [Stylosanthes scabra]|nr:hypothetical protein [Stylosanthes scabra]
ACLESMDVMFGGDLVSFLGSWMGHVWDLACTKPKRDLSVDFWRPWDLGVSHVWAMSLNVTLMLPWRSFGSL